MSTSLAVVRTAVADALEPALPKGWLLVRDHRKLETLDRLTVVLSLTTVARHPDAPMGAFDSTCTVTLVSPITDNPEAAEAQLEENLGELLAAIEDSLRVPWEPATLRLYADRFMCWDVPLHITTTRKD